MTRSQRRVAAAFTFAGAMHFVRPRAYEAIVPPYVPHHREAVQVSGAAEMIGGLAVLSGRTRSFARWWLFAVLVAVFPANVYMAQEPAMVAARGVPANRIPRWLLYARLPLQPLFALAVWRATRRH
ncbi:MAG TPA: hypothetical protein VHJ54_07605 [Solirubrobacterales bacterium]|nr:hypothetical protein [Solirubrobacterales bacterium]